MLEKKALISKIIQFNHLNEEQIFDVYHPGQIKLTQSPRLTEIVDRIHEATLHNQKIFICGDYDVDGLCSTSILVKTLRTLGLTVGFYIPDRFKDGYGINLSIAKMAIEKGYSIILMVDNGVSAQDVIEYCHSLNIDTMVIDHHEIHAPVLARYFFHPDLLEPPFESMCASGLAQQISQALIGEDAYVVSLAGLATIADMMPVFKQNRVLIQRGLAYLNQNHYLNIFALIKDQNILVNEEVLSFQVIPKLNAVGRLSDRANANRVVEYLLSSHRSDVFAFATKIHALNEERKTILDEMIDIAVPQVKDQKVIVLADFLFHEGVVGIAAGKLAQMFQRPAIILNQRGDRLKGSARSYGGLSLSDLFENSFDLLERYGGHAQAAGLELAVSNLNAFIQRVSEYPFEGESQVVYLDAFEGLNLEELLELDRFRPFGQGFKIPSFRFNEARVVSVKKIKSGNKYQIRCLNRMWDVLDFTQSTELSMNEQCSFMAKVSTNSFNGNLSLTLMIEKWL